jgi:hypothetical protein
MQGIYRTLEAKLVNILNILIVFETWILYMAWIIAVHLSYISVFHR